MIEQHDQYGLKLHTEPPTFAVRCTAIDCAMDANEAASTARSYFSDTLTSRTYCETCGNRLRYHRKKSTERGDDVPLSLEDVTAQHNARRIAV